LSRALSCQFLLLPLSCQFGYEAIVEGLVETVGGFEEGILVAAVGIAFAVVSVVEIAVVVGKAFLAASVLAVVAAAAVAAAVVEQKAVAAAAAAVVLETELVVLD
jgi:hypothetical protein